MCWFNWKGTHKHTIYYHSGVSADIWACWALIVSNRSGIKRSLWFLSRRHIILSLTASKGVNQVSRHAKAWMFQAISWRFTAEDKAITNKQASITCKTKMSETSSWRHLAEDKAVTSGIECAEVLMLFHRTHVCSAGRQILLESLWQLMTPSFEVPATGTNAALSQRTQTKRAASALSPTGAARSCWGLVCKRLQQ